jgi:hypothetical protein
MKTFNRRQSPRIEIKLRCHFTSPALWAGSEMYTENISRSGILVAWQGAEAASGAFNRQIVTVEINCLPTHASARSVFTPGAVMRVLRIPNFRASR